MLGTLGLVTAGGACLLEHQYRQAVLGHYLLQVVMNQQIGWRKLGMEFYKVGEKWNHVLGVKPTGWTHSRGEGKEKSLAGISIVTRGHISLLEVPYSEHSSYSELKRFVQFLRIGSERDNIPTINVKHEKEMSLLFKEWIEERKARICCDLKI